MAIQQHDFVELDYTGRLTDGNQVFDTTLEEVAKKEGAYKEHAHYHPAVICIGTAQIITGIDEFLLGKELGVHTAALTSDQAFGKKNTKLLQLIPLARFKEQKIQPMPGLQINIDGALGTVRTSSGGRVIVDFNHPLAGKNVTYELNVKRILQDITEKVKMWLHQELHLDAEVQVSQGIVTATSEHEIPPSIAVEITKKLAPILGIKSLEFRKSSQQNTTVATPIVKETNLK